MILSRVSDYLKTRQRASLHDMALSLETAPDALREMLAVLERKGQVRKLPAGSSCAGGCNKCAPAEIELYEWSAAGSSVIAKIDFRNVNRAASGTRS